MSDISSAGGNVTTQNAYRDSSSDTASELPLQSDTDSTDLTTGEKISRDTTTAEQLKSAQSPLDKLLSDAGEMVADTTDTVADMATDAYEGLQTLNQEYALAQRGMGALKTLGGVGEAFIGSVGIVAPEPATTVGGAILFAHGADVAWSGLQEVWYGEPVETLTDQAVTEGAKLLGADEATAKRLGDGTDIGLSLGSAGIGAYQVLTRPAITQLDPIIVRPQVKSATATEARGAESVSSVNIDKIALISKDAVSAGSVKHVNPTGSLQNCTNCVFVVDNQLVTGAKASALPRSTPLSFYDLEAFYGTKMSGWTNRSAIESTLLRSGNGTRAVIYGMDEAGTTAHVWNAVVQNGKINYIDGQIGRGGAGNFDYFPNLQFGIIK